MTLYGSEGRTGYPRVRVKVNRKIYFDDIVEGQRCIKFTVDHLSTRNVLSIEMIDKTADDTVLEEGKIVKDKKLRIVKVLLDDVDIKNYIYQGRQTPMYHHENQGPKTTIGDQLFFNGPWELYYENPVRLFLAQYHGRGQKIHSPEKWAIKDRYVKQVITSMNVNNDKRY